ncbi:MAG: PIN domain-containing protein [Planctomycetota bacterium]
MPSHDAVFLDTNGWIALLNADDQFHAQAAKYLRDFEVARRTLITTDWVLAETGNGLARVPPRAKFVRAVETFLASHSSRLVRVDAQLFRDALAMYGRAADKSWGLVDCASFIVMGREQVMDALTTDRHFTQAGFRCLLVAPTS